MKKTLCAVLAVIMSVAMFAGCQKNETGSNGKTELILGIPGGADIYMEAMEVLKTQLGDAYDVKADTSAWKDFNQKLKLQMVSKTDVMPVFYTDSMAATTFGAQGAVMDLSDWVADTFNEDDYISALRAITDKEGHLWGVPQTLNPIAITYNKDIFDERGVAYPTEDWTWQDMMDMAKELTFDRDGDGKTDVYGINYAFNITQGWLPFMAAVGVSPYKNDYRDSNLDDPKVKEAMEKYQQPFKDGIIMNSADLAAEGGAPAAFANGKIAMDITQYGQISKINKFIEGKEFNYDAQIMPIGWNGERTCIYVPNTWQVYAGVSEAEKEGALAWLKLLLSEEQQMKAAATGSIMPMKKALESLLADETIVPANFEAYISGIDEYGMTLLENPASASTRTFVDDMTSKISMGEDIDKCIAEAHEAMQNELDYFYENN